ncbi:MAG: hypothetical protein ACJAYB_002234 [Psychromonas sp.]|jgi:hypothetical protein
MSYKHLLVAIYLAETSDIAISKALKFRCKTFFYLYRYFTSRYRQDLRAG